MRKQQIGFLLLLAGMTAVIALITWPRPVQAQCGSSVSSCKDCHEVKKQDSVNATGAWHTAHAFGDFCEFCHAGNVKAKDKAAAHVGLLSPLADVKGSCQSCHPNDFVARAQKYADALGTTLGASVTPAAVSATAAGNATGASTAPCGPSAPAGGQLIDLNKVYAASLVPAAATNVGNIILLGLIGATAALFGGLAWHYEHPLEKAVRAWRRLLAAPALTAPTGAPAPELTALATRLASADPDTLRAIDRILSDGENGARVLHAVSQMDLQGLATLSQGDQKALAALLALAREIQAER